MDLFEKAKARQGSIFKTWKIYHKNVGPHPLPMMELHFQESTREEVIAWIKSEASKHSALIHEDSGDDFKDHTDGVYWIGQELLIDFSFFELVARDPSQAIHP